MVDIGGIDTKYLLRTIGIYQRVVIKGEYDVGRRVGNGVIHLNGVARYFPKVIIEAHIWEFRRDVIENPRPAVLPIGAGIGDDDLNGRAGLGRGQFH